MDKGLVTQIALDSGLELKPLTDGTMGLRPYIYAFANAIAAQVYRDVEPHAAKDEQVIFALRSKVQEQAGEIANLRRAIASACEILDKEVFDD